MGIYIEKHLSSGALGLEDWTWKLECLGEATWGIDERMNATFRLWVRVNWRVRKSDQISFNNRPLLPNGRRTVGRIRKERNMRMCE